MTLSSRAHPGPSPRGLGAAQRSKSLPGRVTSQIAPGSTRLRFCGCTACSRHGCPGGVTRAGTKLWAPTPVHATPCAPASRLWNRQTSEKAARASAVLARIGARRHIFDLDHTWVQSQEDLYAQLRESRWFQRPAHSSFPGACHLLSAALHTHLVFHFFYKTAQEGGVISPVFLSIWFARNCLSDEFYFSPLDLALSRNWSLFLAVLIAILLNHSPAPPRVLSQDFH